MKMIRFFWLFLIAQSTVHSAIISQGVSYNHELLTVEDGLAANEVLCGIQDSRGFIWIGTRSGLNRYDGKSFKLLTKRDGLKSNRVVSLAEDENGLIWISYGQLEGTSRPNGQIDIYDPKLGSLIPLNQKIDSLTIRDENIEFIIGNHLKQIYCLVDSNKVYKYNGSDNFDLSLEPDISLEKTQILNRIYDMRKRYREEKNFLNDDKIFFSGEYPDSVFVIAKALGIETQVISRKKRAAQLPKENNSDKKNRINVLGSFRPIWNTSTTDVLLINDDELFLFRSNAIIPISVDGEIENKDITENSFFTDYQGNMWLGTTQGLHKLTLENNRFKTYFTKKHLDGVYGHEVRGIYADSLDNIHSMGYYYDAKKGIYHKTKIGNYSLFYPEENGAVKALLGSNLYTIHIENKKGIIKVDVTSDTLETGKSMWASYRVSDSLFFSSDINGRTWLCDTNSGKCEILGSCMDSLHFSGDIYKYIYSKNDGHYWAAGSNGLYRISEQFCVTDQFGPSSSDADTRPFPFYDLRDIYIDNHGIFWLASNGDGLIEWDREQDEFTSYTVQDGMPSNVTYCILPDQYGNLWVSTDNGLASFNKQSSSIKVYNESDGIVENEFNRMSSYLASNGRMFFGGINGLISFDPQDFTLDSRDNFLKVEPISYFKYDSKQDVLQDFTYKLISEKEIIINPGDRFFQVDYRLLDYNSDRTLYKYRLLGQDEGWQYTTDDHLRFSGLPYGKYELQIQGRDAANVWTNEVMTIPISVITPWYLRSWAFLLFVLIIIGIFYSIYKYQLARTLREAEKQKLIEIDQLKTKMFSNITHEFRTPLTVILGMTDQLLEDTQSESETSISTTRLKERIRSGGDSIKRNANRLLGLINQMLDLSKIDSGKMIVNMLPADIVVFLKSQIESFQSYATLKNVQLTFHNEFDILLINFDEVKLQQVISNLMSNALKHTPLNGRIDISIRKKKHELQSSDNLCLIEIFNSGEGISQEEMDMIFHRFYQIEGNPHQGTGIGLSLVKEFTELMGGTISVASTPGEGAKFILELPIAQNAQATQTTNIELEGPALTTLIGKRAASIYSPLSEKVDPSKPILLIVEDNEDVAEYIKLCLDDTYRIYVSPDGVQGEQLALDVIPDLIISDIMMPHKDGYELTNTLKQDVRTSHIPIILLTAKSSQPSLIKGLEYGADSYMTKPFDKKELQVRVRKLIEQREVLKKKFTNLIDNAVLESNPESKVDESQLSIDDRFIKAWIDILEKHYEDSEIEVPFLVSQMNMSHSQLYRKLKALTGDSIAGNVRQYRLNKSKKRLAATDETISEIAYKVGFTDPSYFSKMFSSHYNLSPSEYRKSLLN